MVNLMSAGIGMIAGLVIASKCNTVSSKVNEMSDMVEDKMSMLSDKMNDIYEDIMDIKIKDIKDALMKEYRKVSNAIKNFSLDETKKNVKEEYDKLVKKIDKLAKSVKSSVSEN